MAITKANPSQARRLLDTLRDVAPVTYTVLHRPFTGQGGFQSMLRNVQAELGITPTAQAETVTPSRVPVLHETEDRPVQTRPMPPLPVTATDLEREHTILSAARALQAAGETDKAASLLSLLVGRPTEQISRQQAEQQDDDQSDQDDPEDLSVDAVMRRAAKTRSMKAAMKALGRSRKSPKLSQASKAKRAYRMLALHHGTGKAVASRMREKFGADWKSLIKA